MLKKEKIKGLLIVLAIALGFVAMPAVYADDGGYATFTMSPMNQKVILTPGETYEGSFIVSSPVSNVSSFDYKVNVVPFYVTDKYDLVFENVESYNQMVDWISVSEKSGSLAPNESDVIHFSINVPSDAPAGGQYAAIRVSTATDSTESTAGLNIVESYGAAHIIYAEIAGTTVRKGEIMDVDVSGFMFDGNIKGTSSIRNEGNVHGTAKYTLQVFPLFSNEEVYTNEEDTAGVTATILPNRTLYNETEWLDTPAMGIYNVVYTVEFEGSTAQVKKMVIKCPIWLLFIIIFVVVVIIIFIVMKVKGGKKAKRQ